MDDLLALSEKEARERAIRGAIGEGLRQTYDISAPMPDHLVALLNQIPAATARWQQRLSQVERRLDDTEKRILQQREIIAELEDAWLPTDEAIALLRLLIEVREQYLHHRSNLYHLNMVRENLATTNAATALLLNDVRRAELPKA